MVDKYSHLAPKKKRRDIPLKILRQCFTKVQYISKETADIVGEKYGNRTYRCGICKKWHLSSQKKRKKKNEDT